MNQTNHPRKRPSKKTGALEIRLSPEEKSAFLDACQRAGRTASAVLRDAMRGYSQFGPLARLPGSPTMIVYAFAGASLGAFLLLNAVQGADAGEQDRLYGMSLFNSYAVSEFYDHELTLEEYLERSGSVQATFEQMVLSQIDPDAIPAQDRTTIGERSGAIFGQLFIPANLDPALFRDNMERVTDGCWAAMDDVRDARLRRRFESWDADQNGRVTAREFSDATLATIRQSFRLQDADGDGVISIADFDPSVWQARDEANRAASETGHQANAPQRPQSLHLPETACATERVWAQASAPTSPDEFFSGATRGDGRPRVYSAAGIVASRDLDANGQISFAEFVAASGY
jgi:EF hand domain-containing protein